MQENEKTLSVEGLPPVLVGAWLDEKAARERAAQVDEDRKRRDARIAAEVNTLVFNMILGAHGLGDLKLSEPVARPQAKIGRYLVRLAVDEEAEGVANTGLGGVHTWLYDTWKNARDNAGKIDEKRLPQAMFLMACREDVDQDDPSNWAKRPMYMSSRDGNPREMVMLLALADQQAELEIKYARLAEERKTQMAEEAAKAAAAKGAAVVEIMTLAHDLEALHDIRQADEALAAALNEGWDILNLTVLVAGGLVQRVVTLKRMKPDGLKLELSALEEAAAEAALGVLEEDQDEDEALTADQLLAAAHTLSSAEDAPIVQAALHGISAGMSREDFAARFPITAAVWEYGAEAVNDAMSRRSLEAAKKAFDAAMADLSGDDDDDLLPLLPTLVGTGYRAEVVS